MAADDEIRRTFDTLAERLRDEISRQLDEFSGPLATSIDRERAAADTARERAERDVAAGAAETDRLTAALADAEARLAAAVADADARHAAAVAEAEDRLTAAVAVAVAEADDRRAKAVTEADDRRAKAATKADDRHAEALANAEARGRDAARAEWRSMELAASERLADAIRAMDRAHSLSEILDTLASCAGREAARVGVLLVRGSHLRAWRFHGFGAGPAGIDDTTQFELPMADAGIIGDAVRTGAPVSGDSAAHASAPSFADLPRGLETLALPVPMTGQVVAVLYADQGPGNPGDPGKNIALALPSWPASLEVMARHAARCLEAVTACRSAQALTDRRPVAVTLCTDGPGASRADDEQSARRYARLLVSEIKLYHEAAVLAGRRERDLTSRLGGEIARARSLYEQRVPMQVRRSTDYFHDELVHTLADGDGALIA